MAKQSINMRLDKEILNEAKKVLGQKETTATVEMALYSRRPPAKANGKVLKSFKQ
ncbi:hypothetical protein HYW68_00530 [Candidatus Parcubacteria bacterium]|nr:hypothetical protein [Candidatus Parcubacteria bacterium]